MIENLNFNLGIKNVFIKELKEASNGQQNSLLYVKNPIPSVKLVVPETQFQVMVIGGSKFISANVIRENGNLNILKTTNSITPILDNRETLINLIIKHLDPTTKVLALNFAFPVKVVSREGILDGELINGTKEHRINDLIGKIIGFEIEQAISLKLDQNILVTVCNDTVSLGLAGLDILENQGFLNESIAVGIVGTGYNFGFFSDQNTFINLESGNFNNFTPSKTLSAIDLKSSNPTKNLFEKEVAGGYLWQHFNLLSEQEHLDIRIKDSAMLSTIAQNDQSKAGEIARALLKRGAGMVAAHIAALADFMLESKTKQKLNLFVEGSVFWKAFEFEKNVKQVLKELTDKEIVIREIENSAILGTARLVG